MKREHRTARERGFTLVELLTALGIFLLVCGAAFTLLNSSQQRYQTESQVLTSFQEARLGLDQIVRDVNDSGFPPQTFSGGGPHNFYADSPFGWSPGYPIRGNPTGNPCTIGTGGGGTCTTPGDFDLIIETNPNPQDAGSTVQWIRYQLQGTTLMRGMVGKVWGDDPAADTAGNLAPFVQNVVNNARQPIFSYTCDTSNASKPLLCSDPLVGTDNSPANIRDVMITLIVATPTPDATTGQPRLVQLSGRGRRINPNQ